MSIYSVHSERFQKAVNFEIALAAFIGTLATNIVNISLPAISRYFYVDTRLVSWVSIIYLLALCSTIVVFGRLADIRGFKKIFLAGFAVFTIASLLCALSYDIYILIASRGLQAIGAAMFIAVGPAMISTILPPEIRGRSMGYLSIAAAVGIALGPGIGGFLTTYLSWRSIFLVNIPVSIFAIALGMKIIPDVPGSGSDEKVDYTGAFLIMASMAGIAFAMNMGRSLGFGSPLIVASILVFLGCSAAFLLRERGISQPLVDLDLFQKRCFLYANVASMMSMLVFAGAMFVLPFYLQVLRGYQAHISGLILMAPPLAMMLIASFAGSYADSHGSRGICAGASILSVISFVLLSTIDGSTPMPLVIAYTVLMGVSITMFVSPNMSFIMGKCPENRKGIGSSLTMGIRYLGSMIGVASFGAVYSAYLPEAVGSTSSLGIEASTAMASAFHNSFILGIVFSLFMLVFTAMGQWRRCYICPNSKERIHQTPAIELCNSS
ncbi:MAG TPA: MFS transporter [Methanotrichaceae archaeon]|nr:MFS transporter [Methanotrichaceae archaeon]